MVAAAATAADLAAGAEEAMVAAGEVEAATVEVRKAHSDLSKLFRRTSLTATQFMVAETQ